MVQVQVSVSLDGYVAGPNQTQDEPLGERGRELHDWAFRGDETDARIRQTIHDSHGAYIMGRNMFGPADPALADGWRGWWDDEPPYHAPVFVLTHQAREPIEMLGGTTFHFVTDGIDSALEQARAAAGDRDILIAGGANTVNQYLAAGYVDEIYLHIAPVILGGGARLFADVGAPRLEPVEGHQTPNATHIRYRVAQAADA